jgi:hypothetical protein
MVRNPEKLVRFLDRKPLCLDQGKQAMMQVVGKMSVDIEQNIAVLALVDDMLVPDLVEKRFAHGSSLARHSCFFLKVVSTDATKQ